jgi:branched-subunit amino acid transport protein AzlD
MIVLFGAAVLPFMVLINLRPGSFIQWCLYAVPVAIWAFIVIIGGNILIERDMTIDIIKE